jgi:hypothetical protein
LVREIDQGEALGDGEADRGEEEDWDSPARSESTGDAYGYGGVRRRNSSSSVCLERRDEREKGEGILGYL